MPEIEKQEIIKKLDWTFKNKIPTRKELWAESKAISHGYYRLNNGKKVEFSKASIVHQVAKQWLANE